MFCSLTNENLSNGTVIEALEVFQSNIERMMEQGVKYKQLEEGQYVQVYQIEARQVLDQIWSFILKLVNFERLNIYSQKVLRALPVETK